MSVNESAEPLMSSNTTNNRTNHAHVRMSSTEIKSRPIEVSDHADSANENDLQDITTVNNVIGAEPFPTTRMLEVNLEKWNEYNTKNLRRSETSSYAFEINNVHSHSEIIADARRANIGKSRIYYSHTLRRKRSLSIFGLPMIHPHHPFAYWWEFTIRLIDSIYSAFFVPITIALFTVNPEGFNAEFILLVDVCAAVVFLTDFFLNFHIGFIIKYEHKRKVILNGSNVAGYYFYYGGLWIDITTFTTLVYVVCGLAFASIDNMAISFLRLLRLLRMGRVIQRTYKKIFSNDIESTSNKFMSKGFLYCFAVCYILFTIINILSCTMIFVALDSDAENGISEISWLDSFDPGATMVDNLASKFEIYLIGIYWIVTTITTVGYGDIAPQTSLERALMVCVMLTHIMLFSLLIGSITEILKNYNNESALLEEVALKQKQIDSYIEKKDIDPVTANKIHKYYDETRNLATKADEKEIIMDLPFTLRSEVILNETKDFLLKLPMFDDIDEKALFFVAGHLEPILVYPGSDIVNQGDVLDSLFLLQEGKILVYRNEINLYDVNGPQVLGEIALLSLKYTTPELSPMTLRSSSSCIMWKLDLNTISVLYNSYPKLRLNIINGLITRLFENVVNKDLEGYSYGEIISYEFGRLGSPALSEAINRVVTDKYHITENDHEREEIMFVLKRTFVVNKCIDVTDFSDPFHQNKDTYNDKNIEKLIMILYRYGVHGFIELMSKINEKAKDLNIISLSQLVEVLSNYDGLPYNSILELFLSLDNDNDGNIKIQVLEDALLNYHSLRNDEAIIKKTFDILNEKSSGNFDMTKLIKYFKVSGHPDVIVGLKSKNKVLVELIEFLNCDTKIQFKQFLKYHRALSVCIENDRHYIRAIQELWGVN